MSTVTKEQQEQFLTQFERSYDIEIAKMKSGISDDDFEELLRDEEFLFRLKYAEAELKEVIIRTIKMAVKNGKIDSRFRAAVKLGELFYKERFGNNNQDDNAKNRPKVIMLKGVKADG